MHMWLSNAIRNAAPGEGSCFYGQICAPFHIYVIKYRDRHYLWQKGICSVKIIRWTVHVAAHIMQILGMAKEMMSGQQCSRCNNSEISHPALRHARVTFRMPKPEMRKCIHTSIRWKQPWRMFPARNLLRHMILDMRWRSELFFRSLVNHFVEREVGRDDVSQSVYCKRKINEPYQRSQFCSKWCSALSGYTSMLWRARISFYQECEQERQKLERICAVLWPTDSRCCTESVGYMEMAAAIPAGKRKDGADSLCGIHKKTAGIRQILRLQMQRSPSSSWVSMVDRMARSEVIQCVIFSASWRRHPRPWQVEWYAGNRNWHTWKWFPRSFISWQKISLWEEIEKSGFGPYYIDHTVGVWPQAAGGVPFNACEFQSKGDPITDCLKTLLRNRKPGQRTIIFFELSVTFLKLQIRFVFYVREKSYTSSVSGKHFVPYRNSWMRKTSMHSIRALTVHVRRPVKIHNNKETSNKTWRQMLPRSFDILQFHFHGRSRVLFRLQAAGAPIQRLICSVFVSASVVRFSVKKITALL